MFNFDYLTFPGNGVHTVKTAREKKISLIKKLYNTQDLNQAEGLWRNSYDSFEKSDICILGVPSDAGAGIVRGSNWGPLVLREKIESNYFDLGDIKVIPHLIDDRYLSKEAISDLQKKNYKGSKLPVSPLSILKDVTSNFFKKYNSKKLLCLGGDHSISRPICESFLQEHKNVGILHFDAHTDLLEERLGISTCFATWAFHIANLLDNKKKFIQIGIRSSGYDKTHWESTIGLTQYWTKEVKDQGPEKIARKCIEQYKSLGVKKLYLSFDIDAIDMEYASATGTPEKDGLMPFECLIILNLIGKEIPIIAADLVEVAPFVFYPEMKGKVIEPETTLDSAMSIINFLFDHWRS